jgi:hypothetical protein
LITAVAAQTLAGGPCGMAFHEALHRDRITRHACFAAWMPACGN